MSKEVRVYRLSFHIEQAYITAPHTPVEVPIDLDAIAPGGLLRPESISV